MSGTLMGWGLLVLVLLVIGVTLKVAGAPGESRASCCTAEDGRRSRSSGGRH